MKDLMNAREVSEACGICSSTWANWKKKGFAKQFEVSRPVGHRRYARVLVEKYLRGESMSTFGRGGRIARAS